MNNKNSEIPKFDVNLVQLARCQILNEQGVAIPIGTLWQAQTAVMIFLRHFACIACRAHAVQVWRQREDYQKHGAKLYFIGNGSPHFIQMFKESLDLKEASIYTDPSLESFRAAGFKRGFLAAVGPRAIGHALQLVISGHKQTTYVRDAGDLWQLGGVLVILPSGRVGYQFISQATGDFPPEKDLEDFPLES